MHPKNALYLFELGDRALSPREISDTAYALTRAISAPFLRSTPSSLTIVENSYGKPSFVDADGFHFNISHSGNWILIGISEFEIGVDIEVSRAISAALIQRCLTPLERARLDTSKTKRDWDFLSLWTQKEAFLKHQACGITRKLNELEVTDPSIARYMHSFEFEGALIALFCEDVAPSDFSFYVLRPNDWQTPLAKKLSSNRVVKAAAL